MGANSPQGSPWHFINLCQSGMDAGFESRQERLLEEFEEASGGPGRAGGL